MNWRPWAALLVLLVVAVPLGIYTMVPVEGSRVLDPEPGSLVALASDQGWDVKRAVSGPLVADADSELDAGRSILLLVAPNVPYGKGEQDALARFLDDGGSVIVFDAFEQAATLTRGFGIDMERVLLVDATTSSQTWDVQSGAAHWTVSPVRPTALRLDEGFQGNVLAWSSSESFLDRDGDGVIDRPEPHGPFPVIAETIHDSGGRLIVVADAGMVDSGAGEAQNREWFNALLQQVAPGEGRTLLVDEGHGEATGIGASAFIAAVRFAATPPWSYFLASVALVAVAALLLPIKEGFWRPHRFRPDRFIRRDALDGDDQNGPPQVKDVPARQWSPRGTMAVALAIVTLCVGLVSGNAQATMVSVLLWGMLFVAWMPRGLSLFAYRKVGHIEVSEGTDVPVDIALDVNSRGRIHLMDKVSDDVAVRGGTNWVQLGGKKGRTDLVFTVNPPISGPHDIGPLVARAEDPFGLYYQQRLLLPAHRLKVRPQDQDVRKFPHSTKIASLIMGMHLVNKAGEGSEFHALRDFQSGDSFRMVNWKASARSKDLVVNQRVHESMADLTIFLETRALSGAGPASKTPLAQGRRIALSLVSAALRGRDRVRLFTYGDGVQQAPEAPGMQQLHLTNQFLGDLRSSGQTDLLTAVDDVLGGLRPRVPVVIIGGFEGDGSCIEAVRRLRSRNIDPVVVTCEITTAPSDPQDGGPEMDSDAIEAERGRLVQELRTNGVRLYESKDEVPLDYLFKMGGS